MIAGPTLRVVGVASFALALAVPGWSADARDLNGQVLDAQKLEALSPGHSTKDQVKTLLGAPWRIVQFNDCGMAMDGQADETWEYRIGSQDPYRLHVEFDDQGIARLVAKIPDNVSSGVATTVIAAPRDSADHTM